MTDNSQTYSDNDTVETEEEEVVLRECNDCYTKWDVEDYSYWKEVVSSGIEVYVCDDYFTNNYIECDLCSECIADTDIIEARTANVCESCLSDSFQFCEQCAEYVHHDDCNLDANYEYCDSCYTPPSIGIHDYGYQPQLKFKKVAEDGKSNLIYLGVELEVEAPDYE